MHKWSEERMKKCRFLDILIEQVRVLQKLAPVILMSMDLVSHLEKSLLRRVALQFEPASELPGTC